MCAYVRSGMVVVATVVMVVGRDEGSKARKARRKKEGGKVESGGGYGHTELRIVDAFNEVSTRRNGWNGYADLKRVVEAEKWCSSLSRETARERQRGRSVERTKFIFKRTKNNCFDVIYNKPYEIIIVRILND